MDLKMSVIQDNDSQKILASKEINHGDWPFRFMIRIQYTDEWCGEKEAKAIGKYIVGLHVVSPTAAKQTDSFDSALKSYGWTAEQCKSFGPMAAYEMLLEYGTAAHLWESSGNNLKTLMKECRKQLQQSNFLFGFAMDRAENAIGTTGWDAIKGDILAPLRKPSDQPNVQLMQKLQGIK